MKHIHYFTMMREKLVTYIKIFSGDEMLKFKFLKSEGVTKF